jgi:hypothetical protein
MPYPSPDDPDYCDGSRTPVPNHDPDKLWFRCPKCGRLICAMGKTGLFFPHVKNKKRARRGDAIQEGLTAHGLNLKERYSAPQYGPAEGEHTLGPDDIAPATLGRAR